MYQQIHFPDKSQQKVYGWQIKADGDKSYAPEQLITIKASSKQKITLKSPKNQLAALTKNNQKFFP